jgi:hypothetical protein
MLVNSTFRDDVKHLYLAQQDANLIIMSKKSGFHAPPPLDDVTEKLQVQAKVL